MTNRLMLKGRHYLGVVLMFCSLVTGAVTTVTVKVNVLALPGCEINKGQSITVDFGDSVIISELGNVKYLRKIPYTVDCDSESNNAMTLEIQGLGENNMLKTDTNGLVIGLYKSSINSPLPLNTIINFTYPVLPELYALPLKSNGIKPIAGVFSAAATLKASYQ